MLVEMRMTITAKPKQSGSGSEGFIIVAVLWILATLATLVSIYAIYVSNSAIAVAATSDGMVADQLLAAGVELAAYQLTGSAVSERPNSGQFTARVGTARLAVAFQTEAARIDLNAASKDLLAGLFVGFGAAPQDAAGYADRIVAWRTKLAVQSDGIVDTDPENSFYRSAGLSYTPRHAPFAHVDELWLVYGIPRVLIQRALPYVTVYSGQAQVDVIDAAPQVIAALPGMSPQALQEILAARQAGTLNSQTLSGLTGGTGGGGAGGQGGGTAGQGGGTEPGAAATPSSKAFRVGVRIDFDNGRHSAGEAVIALTDDGSAPYRVLSWRNAYDGATEQNMDFGRR
jgi:general secretion pathway protein K